MTSRLFTRVGMFDSLEDLLDYSERLGGNPPEVHRGPDGSLRGSVEIAEDEIADVNQDRSPK